MDARIKSVQADIQQERDEIENKIKKENPRFYALLQEWEKRRSTIYNKYKLGDPALNNLPPSNITPNHGSLKSLRKK